MGTTAEKLTKLLDTKAAIKAALVEKGQAVSDSDTFASYPGKIRSIKTDPTLQSKTVTPSTSAQTVKPDSGYDGLSDVKVNAMPTATQATPSISVDSAGKITASATQSAGYVAAGTKSATKQLTTQAAKTVTPGTSNQTAVASGVYTTGAVTVKGDANLKAANIRSGVSIFGVAGNMQEGIDTSDATAAAGDIISGKTAYVKGTKVTGSMTPIPVLSGTAEPDASLGEDGAIYLVLEA